MVAPHAECGAEWVRLDRPRQSHLSRVPVAILSLALLVFAVSFWRIALRRSPLPAVNPGLSLRADRSGSDFRVSWNGKAATVLAATSGTLSIEDGSFSRELELDREQLQNASLFYSPVSPDVTIRLRITGGSRGPAIESIALHSDLPAQSGPAAQAPRIAVLDRRAASAPVIAVAAPAPAPTPTRQFAMPEMTPRRAAVLEAPALVPGQAALPAAPVALAAAAPQLPPAREPAVTAQPKPAVAAAPAYVPPRPLRRTPPVVGSVVRDLMQTMASTDVRVEVEVQVDAEGNVTSARELSERGGVYRALAVPSVAAARLWKFEPATRGGQPVPGSAVVSFRFTRPRS